MKRITNHAIIFLAAALVACSAEQVGGQSATAPGVTPSAQVTPAAAILQPTPTSMDMILEPEQVNSDSPFCQVGDSDGGLALTCLDNVITIDQSEGRRGMDVIIKREMDVDASGFSLAAEIISNPADVTRLDKNQVGFVFTTRAGRTFALRLEGQFFNFEEWTVEGEKEKIITLNQSYAPQMQAAGRPNAIQIICAPENCDLFSNESLAGRFPIPGEDGFQSIGLFAASPWDERFGAVIIENLAIEALPANRPETLTFSLADDLKADHGTFAMMGLSGAFSDFEADGFHFSPVIPYGYYAAKAGPALRDVSVGAIVEMDFSPGVPATQYGGVICRDSIDGRYLAVLRANATYTIYRDSIRQPFAMLATGTVDTIPAGRSAHRIQLDCIEETITLFIDGEMVESFTDNRFGIQYGRSGLYTKAGGAAYSDAIIFSDLEIKEMR